jgi:hypothetical protein
MFSYDQFKSRVKSAGLSRQNRFYVMISPPVSIGTTDLQTILLMCQTASVQGVSVTTAPVRTTGEQFEAPYDRAFAGASMTFFVDTELKVRYFFDLWINSIQNPQTRTFGYAKEFKSPEIEIGVLKLDDSPSYKIKLYDAFPKSVGALSLSGDNNNIMTLDVQFDYKYYTTEIMTSAELGSPLNQQLLSADADSNSNLFDLGSIFP